MLASQQIAIVNMQASATRVLVLQHVHYCVCMCECVRLTSGRKGWTADPQACTHAQRHSVETNSLHVAIA